MPEFEGVSEKLQLGSNGSTKVVKSADGTKWVRKEARKTRSGKFEMGHILPEVFIGSLFQGFYQRKKLPKLSLLTMKVRMTQGQ